MVTQIHKIRSEIWDRAPENFAA